MPNPQWTTELGCLRPCGTAWTSRGDLRDKWIVDFGMDRPKGRIWYEAPFRARSGKRKPLGDEEQAVTSYRNYWWLLGEPIPKLRKALGRPRPIYRQRRTSSKHRLSSWMDARILADRPDLVVFARDDDTTFGFLQSTAPPTVDVSVSARCLGVGNDQLYAIHCFFETFPFPGRLTPDVACQAYASDPRAKRIAAAAKRLNDMRENWLESA